MTESGVTLKVKWDSRPLERALARTMQVPTARVMRAVSMIMRQMQIRHFQAEVDSRGRKWKPLKQSTIAARRRGPGMTAAKHARLFPTPTFSSAMGFSVMSLPSPIKMRGSVGGTGTPILKDTGRLMGSLTADSTKTEAIVGTNVVYAATHQFGRKGGGWGGSDIPAREFLYINDEEADELVNFIAMELIGRPLGTG